MKKKRNKINIYSSFPAWTSFVKIRIFLIEEFQLIIVQEMIKSDTAFSLVQFLSRVWLFATPWTAARQASLSITNSWSLLKLTCIALVMPSNHLIHCHPLLLPPSISQLQGLFQWVSSLHQVAKVLELQLQHQSFQWIFRTDFLSDWLVGSPCSPRDLQEYSPTPQFKSINSLALSFLYKSNSHIHTWLLEKP